MKWTDNEISLLRQFYRAEDQKRLMQILGNRTWEAIQNQARKLKLRRFLTPKERFFQFVDQDGNDKGCWHWTGQLNHGGYGRFKYNGKPVRAHRFIYKLLHGDIPQDKPFVLHTCDNPRCVNPGHLYAGTHVKNMRDMVEKNRQAKGERHGAAKLSDLQVEMILMLEDVMSRNMIAKYIGTSQSYVGRILRGETRKDVVNEFRSRQKTR